jgi:hypothetical protein
MASNWTPTTVPNRPGGIARFDLSIANNVSISANTVLDGIIFTSTAMNPYSITASPELTLTITGPEITDNSRSAREFVTAVNGSCNFGTIGFIGTATSGTMFTNNGSICSVKHSPEREPAKLEGREEPN